MSAISISKAMDAQKKDRTLALRPSQSKSTIQSAYESVSKAKDRIGQFLKGNDLPQARTDTDSTHDFSSREAKSNGPATNPLIEQHLEAERRRVDKPSVPWKFRDGRRPNKLLGKRLAPEADYGLDHESDASYEELGMTDDGYSKPLGRPLGWGSGYVPPSLLTSDDEEIQYTAPIQKDHSDSESKARDTEDLAREIEAGSISKDIVNSSPHRNFIKPPTSAAKFFDTYAFTDGAGSLHEAPGETGVRKSRQAMEPSSSDPEDTVAEEYTPTFWPRAKSLSSSKPEDSGISEDVFNIEYPPHPPPKVANQSFALESFKSYNPEYLSYVYNDQFTLSPTHTKPSDPGRPAEGQRISTQHGNLSEMYGWDFKHHMLEIDQEDPVVVCNPLGHGSLGVVEEVRRRDTSLPSFVRKRVQLPNRKLQAQNTLKIIQEEAKNLKLLVHPHIVTFVGSYEERRQEKKHVIRHYYCLLMAPVGDNDLKNFLDLAEDQFEQDFQSEVSILWGSWIDSWFICLSSALAYMHENGLRHQDIKPSNIIHRGDRIFFTDFSSSSTFKIGHTTSTTNPSRTSYMYAAPELTGEYTGTMKRHGRGSDVFALGCVFCDMLTVSTNRSVHFFHDHLEDCGNAVEACSTRKTGSLYQLDLISKWFSDSEFFSRHVAPMLKVDRDLRPSAVGVFQLLALDHTLDKMSDICDCLSTAFHHGISQYVQDQLPDDVILIPCEEGNILQLQLKLGSEQKEILGPKPKSRRTKKRGKKKRA